MRRFKLLMEAQTLDSRTYISLLRAAQSLGEVKRIHAHIANHLQDLRENDDDGDGGRGFIEREQLETLLVESYGKCGSAEDARAVFDGMIKRASCCSIRAWNVMIGAYCKSGDGKSGLHLFKSMADPPGAAPAPNQVTFIHAVSAACLVGSLIDARDVHRRLLQSQLDPGDALESAVVHMYGRCGSTEEAQRQFDRISIATKQANVVCWNTLIAAYAHNGHYSAALQVYRAIPPGLSPDKVTLLNALSACSSAGPPALGDGRCIHRRALLDGFLSCSSSSSSSSSCSRMIANALLNMYGKCGSVDEARRIFQEQCAVRDLITWNAMIGAFARAGMSSQAMAAMASMEQGSGVKPDSVTFTVLLGALCSRADLPHGRAVHDRLIAAGLFPGRSVVLDTALLNMYAKCGSLEEARGVFDRIRDSAGTVTWNAMISGCGTDPAAANRLHCQMMAAGVRSDRVTFLALLPLCSSPNQVQRLHSQMLELQADLHVDLANALIAGYSRCAPRGACEDWEAVFQGMRAKSVVTWTSMIEAYNEHGYGGRGIELYRKMILEGIKADNVACICALDCCSSSGDLTAGRSIHRDCKEAGWICRDVIVGTAIVDMYAKCGSLGEARAVFDRMQNRNLVTWNAMIGGYAQHDERREQALRLYQEMELEGMQPDSVTFIAALFACSHLGLLRQGISIFHSMTDDYQLVPATAHFGCIIDLLSRAGWIQPAEEILRRMPIQPSASSWMALLGGCTLHDDLERATRAAQQALMLDSRRATPILLLSNLSTRSSEVDQEP